MESYLPVVCLGCFNSVQKLSAKMWSWKKKHPPAPHPKEKKWKTSRSWCQKQLMTKNSERRINMTENSVHQWVKEARKRVAFHLKVKKKRAKEGGLPPQLDGKKSTRGWISTSPKKEKRSPGSVVAGGLSSAWLAGCPSRHGRNCSPFFTALPALPELLTSHAGSMGAGPDWNETAEWRGWKNRLRRLMNIAILPPLRLSTQTDSYCKH